MRVVFVGKGGAGKSTLAGTFCRLLAEAGECVIAFDGDEVPGLGQVLAADLGDQWSLAGVAARTGEGGGWDLQLTPEEAVTRHAIEVRPRVRLLQFGKLSVGVITDAERSSLMAFHQIVGAYRDDGAWAVADLPAGTLHAYTGWAGTVGVVLVVVQPSLKSLATAHRLVGLSHQHPHLRLAAVANQITSNAEREWLANELADAGIPLWAVVPTDPAVTAAERAGRPLAELDSDCPFVRDVAYLTEVLRKNVFQKKGVASPSG